MWVKVGDNEYYDDSNGILRSASLTHKMDVPMTELDRAGEYTVCWREVFSRQAYHSQLGEIESFTAKFHPIKEDGINLYHISDAHNAVEAPVAAGQYFGEDLDLLILNGDIPDHSGKIENFASIHKIAGDVTKGEHPVIFSRGNHDLRGVFAENLADHTPTDNGRSYYTVRLGSIWAIVLDCGEDKDDSNPEYGHTVCCHNFRVKQTEFLKKVAADPKNEYDAESVKYKIVIVHNPFTETLRPPFDIEKDIYTEWCEILKRIRPDFILAGHTHNCYVTMPGDLKDAKGQPCPVIVGSKPMRESPFFIGCAITLKDGKAEVLYTDTEGNVTGKADDIQKGE
jgi:predicted phosphodiesterase